MVSPHFAMIVLLFLIVLLQRGENSLLSRFKNTVQYEPMEIDPDIEDLDDEALRLLVNEVPQLQWYLEMRRRQMPFLTTRRPDDEFDDLPDDVAPLDKIERQFRHLPFLATGRPDDQFGVLLEENAPLDKFKIQHRRLPFLAPERQFQDLPDSEFDSSVSEIEQMQRGLPFSAGGRPVEQFGDLSGVPSIDTIEEVQRLMKFFIKERTDTSPGNLEYPQLSSEEMHRRLQLFSDLEIRPNLKPPTNNSEFEEDDVDEENLNTTISDLPFLMDWSVFNETLHQHNVSISHLNEFVSRMNETNQNILRGPFDIFWKNFKQFMNPYTGVYKATCYRCGLGNIPRSPVCRDMFDSPNWKYRTLARYFRVKCYHNKFNYYTHERKQTAWKFSYHYRHDRGLKRELYGKYHGGCYKRFLDVGRVYTQRGCRGWPPETGASWSYASHRYKKLELTLGSKKRDRCIFSPHASLTPFARGISLFARYHVCVCHKRFCNSVRTTGSSYTLIIFIVIIETIYYT